MSPLSVPIKGTAQGYAFSQYLRNHDGGKALHREDCIKL